MPSGSPKSILTIIQTTGISFLRRYCFTALFTVLVVVIMLNLLVSLLNDLYEELKGLAKADWCRAQVRVWSIGGNGGFPAGVAQT